MDVSNCGPCRKLLKAELLKGTNLEKLKMKDGHLPGCPSLSPPQKEESNAVRRPQTNPQAWPWAEGNFRIAPTPRPPADAAESAQGWQHGAGGTGDRPTHHDPAGGAGRGTRAPRAPRRGSAGRAEPRGRAAVPDRDHASGYAAVAAEHAVRSSRVQQFKVVDHANSGEQNDHRKGVWFVVIVLLALLITPIFPAFGLVAIGAILMLFLRR